MHARVWMIAAIFVAVSGQPALPKGGGGGGAGKSGGGKSSTSRSSSAAGKTVHVGGYTREKCTYVAPYDRAAPGSGSSSARTTARTGGSLYYRPSARGSGDDDTVGTRLGAATSPRTTARGLTTDPSAEADDPDAGDDDELAIERAR